MGKRIYEIAFVGLQPGTHNFEYQIDDSFFEAYQAQDFTNCNAIVKLSLEKNTGFMQLKFAVGGNLISTCDRCGNDLPITLWEDFLLIVKLVENPDQMNDEEKDPDVFYISRTESLLNVKDWLYEFVNLSVPNQKSCPIKEDGGSGCNQEVLKKLNQLNDDSIKVDKNNIWKGLEKFKNIDNN